MELYVCYTTAELHIRPGGHPCANAYKALKEAGYDPEVKKIYSFGAMPDALQTGGRKLVKQKTGSTGSPRCTPTTTSGSRARRRSSPGPRSTPRPGRGRPRPGS